MAKCEECGFDVPSLQIFQAHNFKLVCSGCRQDIDYRDYVGYVLNMEKLSKINEALPVNKKLTKNHFNSCTTFVNQKNIVPKY